FSYFPRLRQLLCFDYWSVFSEPTVFLQPLAQSKYLDFHVISQASIFSAWLDTGRLKIFFLISGSSYTSSSKTWTPKHGRQQQQREMEEVSEALEYPAVEDDLARTSTSYPRPPSFQHGSSYTSSSKTWTPKHGRQQQQREMEEVSEALEYPAVEDDLASASLTSMWSVSSSSSPSDDGQKTSVSFFFFLDSADEAISSESPISQTSTSFPADKTSVLLAALHRRMLVFSKSSAAVLRLLECVLGTYSFPAASCTEQRQQQQREMEEVSEALEYPSVEDDLASRHINILQEKHVELTHGGSVS
ncbi:hypothetical protein DNTS_032957, partial [Danionella cerebrum]